MHRIVSFFALTALLTALFFPVAALATKAYTTDTQEVPMRLNPRSDSKAIAAIPPASAIELVNPNAWIHVRYTKPTGEMRDGWVQARFVGPKPPESAVARELGAENGALKEQLATIEKEKAILLQKEKELTDKLTKLNSAYEELKGGSANYLKLKGEYDTVKANLASAQENVQALMQDNYNLKLSERIRWFVVGAVVILAGWLLGWFTTRRVGKKKSTYYY